jgi:hypothetical protein
MQDSTILKLGDHEEAEDIHPAAEGDFTRGIEALAARAEEFRLQKMRLHSTRTGISLILGMLILLAGASGFGWYFLMEGDLARALLSIALAIALPAWLQHWAAGPIRSYRREFKTRFMPDLARTLGGLTFYPSRGISESLVRKSGIIPHFDHYSAEDCFMGRYAGVKVILSEARLSLKKKPVFQGVFALLDVETEHFEGSTIITANPALKKGLSRNLKSCPVHLPGQSHDLAAFTTLEAPSPLAADGRLMKELNEMSLLFESSPLSAIFWHGHYVFIAIPYGTDMFECSNLFIPVTTHGTALQCRKEIDQLLSIIDVVRLYKKPS